jgi:multidrug efflux pump
MSVVVLAGYAGLLYVTGWEFSRVPTGFIPPQDKGYLLVNVQLPDSASLERTQSVIAKIERIALSTPGAKHTVSIAGQSILLNANGSNLGTIFVTLDEFQRRRSRDLRAQAIGLSLRQQFRAKVPEAVVALFGAPPVDGLGTAGGFKIMIEDRGDNGPRSLQGQVENFIEKGVRIPGLVTLFSMFRANAPQLYADVDRAKCKNMEVSLQDVFNTLQVYLGSLYVNDFNRFGRTWQVNLQADAAFRVRPEDVRALKVRNSRGKMVPIGALADVRQVSGPVTITRYNMYPAAAINGNTAPGVSSGQVIDLLGRLAEQELPKSMTHEWTELTYMQILAGNTAMIVFAGAVVLVFLVLAAQYESWSLPLAVILVVPMCLLCSVTGVVLAGTDINIFTQIGFVVLVGLASKNAILIVEFAKSRREAGVPGLEATLEACRLRLRPILMTSFAFILGVVPLVLAGGAGWEMRRTLGLAVFSGMLGVTLFGIFLTPVFYYVIQWLDERRRRPAGPAAPAVPRLQAVERGSA